MALFRKFFYRKPPDGLLEISERVFVFDCCFTTDVLEDNEYKVYMGGIVAQLQDHFPDASFMVFNFREGERQSQICSILSEYDMTVMDYPRHYESCPILTMEMIHHFLRSSESWLSLGQTNVLLMHCERGGWPVLAFMLAALLIYRKQYTGEQKTLDMIYKQAPRELLQLMSPLNPLPSQLRYLQYVSRRNVGSEWPPLDRALTLDCVILSVIPNLDGNGGCRPIFRIYGQDPFMASDRTPKVLFSTPKGSKTVRQYKQADCELVKIDIHCHIQGDVVLECISLDDDLEREEMMFKVMFNTAFIRSNILMLNREEIDILWDSKDQFPKDFRAEVLFSEMDAASSLIALDLPGIEDKEGLPIEAFAKVQEIFSNVDWLVPKTDIALNVIQQITVSNIIQEKLEIDSPQSAEAGNALRESLEKAKERLNIKASENKIKISSSLAPGRQSLPTFKEANLIGKKIDPCELHVALQRPAQLKIIQRMPQKSQSNPVSYSNSLQGSPGPISRYHSAPSVLGITALLQDHAASNSEEITHAVIKSPSSPVISAHSISNLPKPAQPSVMPIPPPPPQPRLEVLTTTQKSSGTPTLPPPPPPPPPPQTLDHLLTSKVTHSMVTQHPGFSLAQGRGQLSSVPPLPPPPISFSGASLPHTVKNSFSPPTPLPSSSLSSFSCTSSSAIESSISTPPTPPPPPPPPSGTYDPSLMKKSSLIPPSPPPPPGVASIAAYSISSPMPMKSTSTACPPPPPPPTRFADASGPILASSAPPPPPPPGFPNKDLVSTNSPRAPPVPPPPSPPGKGRGASLHAPPVPPPPAPPGKGGGASLHAPPVPPPPAPPGKGGGASPHAPPVPPPPAPPGKGGGASLHSHSSGSNGNVPPIPAPPFSAKGRIQPRTGPRNQGQTKKNNLKPYHWLKLTRAMQGSLWAEAQKTDEASKAPEFDMSELESLFSAAAPNSGSTGGKSNLRASGPKSDKVHLIELRRAYNCEIMLSKVKVPLPDLMSSVLALDDTALDVDQVDNLIKFCPTKEEMEQLKGYNGDKENLGKCEQFFLELMKVPRVESKLRVFSFKIQFRSQVSDLRKNLNIVNATSDEIRNSAKLKRIMQTILSLGNALNHGTARGSAIGFRLDSLLKLTDTRARNKKMTLMHYLCKVLSEKLPELLDFSKDLVSLEASTKIQLKYLAEEMQAISKGLEKVVQELTASENDGHVSDEFCKILKEFLGFAEAEVRSLAYLYSGVGRNADALAQYFGEDPARCPFEQVVSTLLNFVRMFVRAHDENCKQLEFEKKKAQKEAENEKKSNTKKESENVFEKKKAQDRIKKGTPKKESDGFIQTPIKSGNTN